MNTYKWLQLINLPVTPSAPGRAPIPPGPHPIPAREVVAHELCSTTPPRAHGESGNDLLKAAPVARQGTEGLRDATQAGSNGTSGT